MISSFWWLETPSLRHLAEWTPDNKDELIICPIANHRRGGKRIGDLSILVHPSGVKYFTWSWYSDILVSPRALKIFEKYRVTGFEIGRPRIPYPKTITASPPELFALIVTGWGGFAAAAAGVSLAKSCPACGHKEYVIAEPARLIDPAAWDGSDLFIVWPLPKFRFASDRLARILREERISGVDLIPAADISVERGNVVTPGAIEISMPEDRARELEQRFGVSHWLEETYRARSSRDDRR